MEIQKRQETFSNKGFGPVLNWVGANLVDLNVPDCGKHGEYWKLKRATMQPLDAALIVPWMPTKEILQLTQLGP